MCNFPVSLFSLSGWLYTAFSAVSMTPENRYRRWDTGDKPSAANIFTNVKNWNGRANGTIRDRGKSHDTVPLDRRTTFNKHCATIGLEFYTQIIFSANVHGNSPEAEFLDEIQTKVLRVFLLAIHSHLYSFALRFIFLQTHATSSLFLQTTQPVMYFFKPRNLLCISSNHATCYVFLQTHATSYIYLQFSSVTVQCTL